MSDTREELDHEAWRERHPSAAAEEDLECACINALDDSGLRNLPEGVMAGLSAEWRKRLEGWLHQHLVDRIDMTGIVREDLPEGAFDDIAECVFGLTIRRLFRPWRTPETVEKRITALNRELKRLGVAWTMKMDDEAEENRQVCSGSAWVVVFRDAADTPEKFDHAMRLLRVLPSKGA